MQLTVCQHIYEMCWAWFGSYRPGEWYLSVSDLNVLQKKKVWCASVRCGYCLVAMFRIFVVAGLGFGKFVGSLLYVFSTYFWRTLNIWVIFLLAHTGDLSKSRRKSYVVQVFI